MRIWRITRYQSLLAWSRKVWFWAAHSALKQGVPDAICHIILTHTPQAASFPTSLEGKILYYVDQIDVLAIHGDRWRKQLMITK